MKVKLTSEEIKKYLNAPNYKFPKYSTQLLNIANQNARATRPDAVGQLSELIKEFRGESLEKWEEWYLKNHPKAIEIATNKIGKMIQNFRDVLDKIDAQLIENWVKDLVIVKTFVGLKFQEAILKKGAELLNTDYRLSTPEDESKGIDGFIGDVPVSIKPDTYKTKRSLQEKINAKMIYYKKIKDGVGQITQKL